ncbi:MAG: type II toxin-antitoxin system RelE/ParE family toxin [Magnetococcus sp. THC-1_WYH]
MADDHYRLLQEALVLRPQMGDIIQGSGGVRKVRWTSSGGGKRGGTRIIYYWAVGDETLFMLLAYAKSKQQDMTFAQVQTLRKIVEAEFGHG